MSTIYVLDYEYVTAYDLYPDGTLKQKGKPLQANGAKRLALNIANPRSPILYAVGDESPTGRFHTYKVGASSGDIQPPTDGITYAGGSADSKSKPMPSRSLSAAAYANSQSILYVAGGTPVNVIPFAYNNSELATTESSPPSDLYDVSFVQLRSALNFVFAISTNGSESALALWQGSVFPTISEQYRQQQTNDDGYIFRSFTVVSTGARVCYVLATDDKNNISILPFQWSTTPTLSPSSEPIPLDRSYPERGSLEVTSSSDGKYLYVGSLGEVTSYSLEDPMRPRPISAQQVSRSEDFRLELLGTSGSSYLVACGRDSARLNTYAVSPRGTISPPKTTLIPHPCIDIAIFDTP
ncbi:hypothetical protein WKR88_09460 [Trinickia caryophylli]|uniref:Uncharacterized protein n=1 Tax=Trinickia caryophylli TaxID=28094 RepID=A0A1X7FAH7_TRICW|nr:hypothetical protein [Trinickia caryophylli]PMS10959.1 hypothetical protein C0Z17_17440 [Trinickia caryophylli]TRX18906.1 hypothetical protein FNF07_12150 [Trinickia caryophylli]WQE10295.1 hypothetical protein U0034_10765 [Trinickia caryophylli]SMF48902.1 hypothetical protein SAMN06295900_108105 [Trinickia caryophylli]GLU34257.1 hypothetical protein Busp01_40990 [Trinickia caryophylli]